MIDKPKFGVYYMAEIDNIPVGMTMVHFETQPRVGGFIHQINSVYVHPDHRKKGVFRALYNHIVEIARLNPMVKAVRLYVYDDNTTA